MLHRAAQVKQLPEEDRRRHGGLVGEFANATHWPKHLLVHYRWAVQHEVDAERGLTVLFGAGTEAGGRAGAQAGGRPRGCVRVCGGGAAAGEVAAAGPCGHVGQECVGAGRGLHPGGRLAGGGGWSGRAWADAGREPLPNKGTAVWGHGWRGAHGRTPACPGTCAHAGVAASLLLGLSVVRSYRKHLSQFIADFAGDSVGGGGAVGAAAVPLGPKAE